VRHADSRQTTTNMELRKWPNHSKDIRNKYSLPAFGKEWTGRPGTSLLGLPATPRMVDVLDTSFSSIRSKCPDRVLHELLKNLWANPSQSVARLPISYGAPTPATSTIMYSFEKDRCVSPSGWMHLLGWPRSLTPSLFSESEYAQIAGNGFSAPVAAMISVAMYSNPFAPWWA